MYYPRDPQNTLRGAGGYPLLVHIATRRVERPQVDGEERVPGVGSQALESYVGSVAEYPIATAK